MLKIVLKHYLFDLKDGISQRESNVRLSLEHQNLFFFCFRFIITMYYIIS